MRHGKKFNHLGRTASHRKAMLSNMATSLILSKRITTTVAKAKELRKYVEPLITKAKDNTTHSRRVVFSYLQNKDSVKELFGDVAAKVAERPGGYTRILKIGNRLGDNAEMAIIELVDYNELMLTAKEDRKAATKTKTRRSRRGGGSTAKAKDAVDAGKKSETSKVEKAPKAEVKEETPVAEVKEETLVAEAKQEAPAPEESTDTETGAEEENKD